MSEYKDGLSLLFMYLRVINLRVTLFKSKLLFNKNHVHRFQNRAFGFEETLVVV